MSRDFEEVVLSWNGKEYRLPPDQVLPCIARIENVLTLGDLAQASLGKPMLAKLSMAFGIALRMAGANVTDKEVWEGMFSRNAKDIVERMQRSVFALQSLMIPPEHLRGEPGKRPEAAGRRAASSRRRTSS